MKNELDHLSRPAAARAIERAFSEGWIKPQPVQHATVVRLLQATVDLGEAEAIALALEVSANRVLLDDRDARAAAERAGLQVTGALGVLLRAKMNGQIHAVKPEIDALRARARFFISSELDTRVVDFAGDRA